MKLLIRDHFLRRPSSPTRQMEQLLAKVDENIGQARNLKISPPPSYPVQPFSPSHIVHNHYHGPGESLLQQGPGVHQSSTQPHHPYSTSHQHLGATCTVEQGHNDNGQAGMISCSQYLEQARELGQPRSPGRREKSGRRPRVSASDIVPPERVAEEALRTTRMQYFADLQRLQQKRLQDAAGVQ